MAKQNAGRLDEVFENIRESFDNRMTDLRSNISQTHKTLSRFKNDHRRMSKELRTYLKNNTRNVSKKNMERLEDFQKFSKKLSKENTQEAKDLKVFLKQYNLDRLQDFYNFVTPLRKELKSLHNAFKTFQSDMAKRRKQPLSLHTRSRSPLRLVASSLTKRVTKKNKTRKKSKARKKKR